MKTLGIDGCRAGWIAISLDDGAANYWVLEKSDQLADFFTDYDRVMIDIPIGVPELEYHRTCDQLLRKELGPDYAASIFHPPIRAALYAPTYGEASVESYEATGKKISVQSWNIVPKIRAVDQLLQQHEEFRDKVLESHPEFLFQKLNGGSPILQKKATKKGLRHRLSLLKPYSSQAVKFFREIKEEYRRNQVAEDDIVDALVLALYAKWSVEKEIKTLPEDPPEDPTGLKMAIHYLETKD